MFYLFRQNNSGGSFDMDDCVDMYVIIEANSSDEANNLARGVGIYFDGIDNGQDCECCGDRWYPVDGSGDKTPSIYGISVADYLKGETLF